MSHTAIDKARQVLRFTWFSPALVALFVGWIFLNRWLEARRVAEQQREERQIRENQENRRAFENLGGNRFEILHFYAMPPRIRRGESTTLCYGVSNAKTAALDPHQGRVWPSANRCFEVSPQKDTTYTLTITDGAGHTRTASISLSVR